MLKKVFNQYNYSIWSKWCLSFFAVLSGVAIFLPNYPAGKEFIKYIVGGVLLFLLIASYFGIAIYQIRAKSAKIIINNTEVNIFFGDIFEQEGKKVIAFNEYFDTQTDDVIIAKKSLNGIVIDNKYIDKEEFDKIVSENSELITNGSNPRRKQGKTQKYKLGQIQAYKDYYALAFTKFDNDNKANLTSIEYSACLLEMWRQLNKIYAQNTVNVPLLGSGITRILDSCNITNQELLEIMLETLNISKMSFKEPSKINIVLYPGEKDNCDVKKYDLIRIKSIFKR